MNNIFNDIPQNLDNELFEELVKTDNITIERIISKGHQSPISGWYDQEQDEWVMVLSGKAIILFEDDTEVTMKNGDHIIIPAHQKHKVIWTEPDIETIWLAVLY